MSIPVPCIERGCTNMAMTKPRRPRCRSHQRAWDADRNARPERAAYRDPAYKAISVQGQVCVDCGSPDVTKDHVVELHQGGSNEPSNIEPRCLSCNVKKSNRERRKS